MFWLIVVFLGASALFILLGIDFIALIFLIVYVGANFDIIFVCNYDAKSY